MACPVNCLVGLPRLFTAQPGSEVFQQGESSGYGEKKNLFEDGAAVVQARPVLIRFRLHLKLQHAQVFCKIYSTLFAFPPL